MPKNLSNIFYTQKKTLLLKTMNTSVYKTLFKRLGQILLLYTFCRIMFSIMNDDLFAGVSISNYLLALLHGLRFDLAAIIYLNILFILISIIPLQKFHSNVFQKGLKTLFFATNIPMLILNIVDIEYFKFSGKRTQSSVLGITQDIKAQAFQIFTYYWYFVIAVLALVYILWHYYPKLNIQDNAFKLKKWQAWVIIPFVIGFSVIGARGGLQLKPLTPSQAFVITPQILGHFTLNSPYVFLSSFAAPGKLEELHYFKTDEEAKNIIAKSNYTSSQATKDNVVIIILESFDSEYLGIGNNYKGYTPFFDSLARKSLYFNHCFANGRTSIEALPSILASVPSLMQEPYITSYYQDNNLNGLGTVLKQHGYQTAFFHGGKNGTMNFNTFAAIAGYDKYYGLNEYPNQKDFDGNWGIFDEPYLQYFAQKMSEMKEPFATSIFTLSSHHPYTIPSQHKGKFAKGDLEIHETIGYSDYALKKFFETASKMPWYKNTLFVLTADHTQMTSKPEYQNTKGLYSIPLVFFHPSKNLQADTSIITQQTDIMPSVLSYLGIENKHQIIFGKSVFDPKPISEAVNYSEFITRVFSNKHYIEFNNATQQATLHNLADESINPDPKITNELTLKAKAYQQYFHNSLIKNKW